MASSTVQQASDQHRYHLNPCAELVPWIPDPSEIEVLKVQTGPRPPRPRYGWHGQTVDASSGYEEFPVGSRWRIGCFFTSPLICEVIPMGPHPYGSVTIIHLRVIQGGVYHNYPQGYEDYWNTWQLKERMN